MNAYKEGEITENLTSTSLENNITAALRGSEDTKHLTSTSPENNVTAALTGSNRTENLVSTSLENDRKAALKCLRKPTVDVDDFTNLYLAKNLCQIASQKAVAVRHANVFTARLLCFRRFPVAPLQLGSPARNKIHFPGLYCENTHSLRPSKMTFPDVNLDQSAILNGMNNGTAYANPELDMKIQ